MDKADYKEFLESVELTEIVLVSLTVEQTKRPSSREEIAVKVERDFAVTDWSDEALRGQGTFKLTAGTKQDPTLFFRIDICFEASYTLNRKISEDPEIKEVFANRNLPINIWPYVRELVSSLTAKMGYPALTLGVLKR